MAVLAYQWRTRLVCLKCSRKRMVDDLVPRGALARADADKVTPGRLRRMYVEIALNAAHTTKPPAAAPQPVTGATGTCSTCRRAIK